MCRLLSPRVMGILPITKDEIATPSGAHMQLQRGIESITDIEAIQRPSVERYGQSQLSNVEAGRGARRPTGLDCVHVGARFIHERLLFLSQSALWRTNRERKPGVGRLDDVKHAVPELVFSDELAQFGSRNRLSSLDRFSNPGGLQTKPCLQVVADQINCAKEPPSTLCGEGPGRRTPVGIVAKRTVPVDIRDATLKSAAGDPGGAGLRSQLLKALDHLAIEPGATNCDDEIRCDFGRTLSQYWRASGTARASP